jgi:UDP-N-acetylglucosamine acyltransferase
MPTVHPTAIVSKHTELAEDAQIGPYCVLDGAVTLGPGVRLISHVVLRGPVEVGAGTQVWPFAAIGCPPQDYKFGPDSVTAGVRIGQGCLIRESVTIHASTSADRPTTIGDRVFMMASTHAAHDCTVEDEVVMVNYAGLAGHAHVGRKATLSGGAIVHQFCRIGRLAFMSGGTGVSADVPPFCVVNERQRLGGVNLVGMRRAGMDRAEITAVRRAFREALRPSLPRAETIGILERLGTEWPAVAEMAEFVRTAKRPVCPGRGRPPRLGVKLGSAADDDGDAD